MFTVQRFVAFTTGGDIMAYFVLLTVTAVSSLFVVWMGEEFQRDVAAAAPPDFRDRRVHAWFVDWLARARNVRPETIYWNTPVRASEVRVASIALAFVPGGKHVTKEARTVGEFVTSRSSIGFGDPFPTRAPPSRLAHTVKLALAYEDDLKPTRR